MQGYSAACNVNVQPHQPVISGHTDGSNTLCAAPGTSAGMADEDGPDHAHSDGLVTLQQLFPMIELHVLDSLLVAHQFDLAEAASAAVALADAQSASIDSHPPAEGGGEVSASPQVDGIADSAAPPSPASPPTKEETQRWTWRWPWSPPAEDAVADVEEDAKKDGAPETPFIDPDPVIPAHRVGTDTHDCAMIAALDVRAPPD